MTGRARGPKKSWHSPAEIKRLDLALRKLGDHNGDTMTVPEIDGFCTGLILCPEMIPSDQWLKEIWGGQGEPDFESVDAFATLMELVMDHCDRIVAQLAAPAHYRPALLPHRKTDAMTAIDWVRGFIRAACLDPDGWERFLASADDKTQTAFVLLLELSLLGTSESRLDETEQSELLVKGPELIPRLILTLNWFHAAPAAGRRSATIIPFPEHRTSFQWGGRRSRWNASCPCGSGRPYTRCCGSN
jgi:uncharacterized protein